MHTRTPLFALALTAALLLAGCDSSGSEPDRPDPFFEATLSGAMDASLKGTAALEADFGAGSFFVHNLPSAAPFSGRTITAIRLRDADAETVTHEVGLAYFGDDRLAPGTYDANPKIDSSAVAECLDAEAPPLCIRNALGARFSTSYTRQTADSLYNYQISEGEITVETSSDDLIEGAFQLEAGLVTVVARAEMEQFREALREWDGDRENIPPFPESTFRPLRPALTLDGTFTAAPADLPPLGS